ncbi:MAG: hypothetical protein WKF37_14590 [Bryobacteraceae bacterium]
MCPTFGSIAAPDLSPIHNSEDKPDTVDRRSLHDLTAIIATYLYYNAAAGRPTGSQKLRSIVPMSNYVPLPLPALTPWPRATVRRAALLFNE